jgi:hypothetical protein
MALPSLRNWRAVSSAIAVAIQSVVSSGPASARWAAAPDPPCDGGGVTPAANVAEAIDAKMSEAGKRMTRMDPVLTAEVGRKPVSRQDEHCRRRR